VDGGTETIDSNERSDTNETCAQCRFDGGAYTDLDVAGTIRAIPPWWELMTRGIDDVILQARPAPGVWSAVEYAEHTTEITRVLAAGLEALLEHDGIDVGTTPLVPPVAPEPSCAPAADVLAALDAALLTLGDAVARAAAEPERFLVADGERYTASWIARHAIHDALHHLQDVGRGLHALGAGVASQRGAVAQINVSDGGVPKLPVERVTVGFRGLEHDRQRSRRHHGRVWQALCLYSTDAIATLQAQGHPIDAGSAGENFTISGVEWSTLRPGVRIRIGEVLAELSVPALPCAHNARWFLDGDFSHMHHDRNYELTRWYARVLEDGTVTAGDPVDVEPA
jgi:MOSC domain-containing protein YiiM